MYSELLKKLGNERIEFERKLNAKKQNWQVALNVEKEMMEMKMKKRMEKWKEGQQAEEKNVMANKIKLRKKTQILTILLLL